MDITNKKVMILGAWGLVGNAITRKILEEEPSHLILTSLRKEEVEEYKRELLRLHTSLKADQITTWWGR
jgi:FlaA1/EpsC-like NDP-sugar epimerase